MFKDVGKYILSVESDFEVNRYFVSIKGNEMYPKTEISYDVYRELSNSKKQEQNLNKSDSRYIDLNELSDFYLSENAKISLSLVRDMEINIEDTELVTAFKSILTETQCRRFDYRLYSGLTYEQIAEEEGCSKISVYESFTQIKKKLEKFIKTLENTPNK